MPVDARSGPILLALARTAISSALGQTPPPPDPGDAPWLWEKAATFVTLTQFGALRGCIGTLEAYRPLIEDVTANAVAAAMRDPRFQPLRARELDSTRIEVSLLSPPEPLPVSSEDEAIAHLRPRIDGVIFESNGRRATFLPQVWQQLPDPRAFLAQLKRKAGLTEEGWGKQVRLSRYSVTKWKEAGQEAGMA